MIRKIMKIRLNGCLRRLRLRLVFMALENILAEKRVDG